MRNQMTNEEISLEVSTTVSAEDDTRSRGQIMEDGLRWFADFIFRPFLWIFGGFGLSPNMITILGMAFAVGSGYFLAVENVFLAAVLFTVSGLLDLVDGYVAQKLDRVTVFGSFLDSFSDRIADSAIYLGLAVYFLKRAEGLYVGLTLVILVISFLISYIRAKATSLGATGKAGLMARAPRFLALGFGLFFNGLSPWILRGTLWIIAVLLLETLVERLVKVWKELEG